jgi:hypothetical protein
MDVIGHRKELLFPRILAHNDVITDDSSNIKVQIISSLIPEN